MSIEHLKTEEKKEANYRKLVREKLMEDLRSRILDQLLVKKKYKEHGYGTAQLAHDLQTNVRYISAVIRVQFHTNYSSLINKYRVEEAMSLLTDSRYAHLNVEEIGYMVGFEHRQTFYTAFNKLAGLTPMAYRKKYE